MEEQIVENVPFEASFRVDATKDTWIEVIMKIFFSLFILPMISTYAILKSKITGKEYVR